MKPIIGKVFCLFTIFLLSSNVALLSILPKVDTHSDIESLTELKKENNLYQSVEGDKTSLNLLSEKDPLEEFEFVKGHHTLPKITIKDWFKIIPSFSFYKQFSTAHLKIPLWLWVRHIII